MVSLKEKNKLCPVAADGPLSFSVQRDAFRKMQLGCRWPVSAMIDLSRLEGGAEEDLYDQS